jgi:hypothetical protein
VSDSLTETAQPLDPLTVECPRCGSLPSNICRRPNGKPAKVHKDRIAAAETPEYIVDPLDILYTDEGRKLYTAIVTTLTERQDANRYTKMLALRIAKNVEQADNLHEIAARSPVEVGSNGQPVANPAWAGACRLEDRVLADLKALRLTPDSAGWQPSKDPEPDELDALDQAALKRTPRKQ